jgi:probable rRNA maturation factor
MNSDRSEPPPAPAGGVEVVVQRACRLRGLPTNGAMRRWLGHAVGRFRPRASLTVRIVDADEGAALNERWRGKPGPTNVLSFPVSGLEELAPELLGDIVLCAPVLAAEAAARCKGLDAHCAHLLVHGALHLLGYDHQEPRAAAAMERLETELLAELAFPDPYAEDVTADET